MKLLSKKLQFHRLLLLTCVLLIVFSLGVPLAYAEEDGVLKTEASDAELERIRLSQCVFTIEDGEIYWMSLTEEELQEYAEYLKAELNLSTAAAAGILSNIQCESGFDPTKLGDDGEAFGICQWRGPRLDQMAEYCEGNDLNPVSLEGQLAFLVHDLQENYIYPYDLVRLVSDSPDGATDAAYYFCAYYEVPADPDSESADRVELCDILFYPSLLDLEEE